MHQIKKELDDTRTICQQFTDKPDGVLKVTVFEYFTKQLVFPKLTNFLSHYPKLEVNLYISERVPNFEQEQIDLAVGFSLPAGDEIARRSLLITPYVLCASPAYFKKYGIPQDLSNLHQHF